MDLCRRGKYYLNVAFQKILIVELDEEIHIRVYFTKSMVFMVGKLNIVACKEVMDKLCNIYPIEQFRAIFLLQ